MVMDARTIGWLTNCTMVEMVNGGSVEAKLYSIPRCCGEEGEVVSTGNAGLAEVSASWCQCGADSVPIERMLALPSKSGSV